MSIQEAISQPKLKQIVHLTIQSRTDGGLPWRDTDDFLETYAPTISANNYGEYNDGGADRVLSSLSRLLELDADLIHGPIWRHAEVCQF